MLWIPTVALAASFADLPLPLLEKIVSESGWDGCAVVHPRFPTDGSIDRYNKACEFFHQSGHGSPSKTIQQAIRLRCGHDDLLSTILTIGMYSVEELGSAYTQTVRDGCTAAARMIVASMDQGLLESIHPLVISAEHGNLEIVEHLIQSGLSIEDCRPAGNPLLVSALSSAACADHLQMVAFLLAQGANVKESGVEALLCAVYVNNMDMLKLLVDRGAPYWAAHAASFRAAAANGNLPMVRYFLSLPELHADRVSHFFSALREAARGGHIAVVMELLARGVRGKSAALIAASRHEQWQTAMLLLEYGANPNIGEGAAMRWSIVFRNPYMLQQLIVAGGHPWIHHGVLFYDALQQREPAALRVLLWHTPADRIPGILLAKLVQADAVEMLDVALESGKVAVDQPLMHSLCERYRGQLSQAKFLNQLCQRMDSWSRVLENVQGLHNDTN